MFFVCFVLFLFCVLDQFLAFLNFFMLKKFIENISGRKIGQSFGPGGGQTGFVENGGTVLERFKFRRRNYSTNLQPTQRSVDEKFFRTETRKTKPKRRYARYIEVLKPLITNF